VTGRIFRLGILFMQNLFANLKQGEVRVIVFVVPL